MRRYVIQQLEDPASPPRSIPGNRTTVFLPEIPPHVRTPQQLLRWLTTAPDVFAGVLANLFPLVDEPDLVNKPPENPGPPS